MRESEEDGKGILYKSSEHYSLCEKLFVYTRRGDLECKSEGEREINRDGES